MEIELTDTGHIQTEKGAMHRWMNSGEDYAFAIDRFHMMALPTAVEKTLLTAAKR